MTPYRKELLDICQRIQDEQDKKRLQKLLDELSRVLDEVRIAIARVQEEPAPPESND
jgi:hypothetical protein